MNIYLAQQIFHHLYEEDILYSEQFVLPIYGCISDPNVQFEFLWLDFAGGESLTGLMVHCNR